MHDLLGIRRRKRQLLRRSRQPGLGLVLRKQELAKGLRQRRVRQPCGLGLRRLAIVRVRVPAVQAKGALPRHGIVRRRRHVHHRIPAHELDIRADQQQRRAHQVLRLLGLADRRQILDAVVRRPTHLRHPQRSRRLGVAHDQLLQPARGLIGCVARNARLPRRCREFWRIDRRIERVRMVRQRVEGLRQLRPRGQGRREERLRAGDELRQVEQAAIGDVRRRILLVDRGVGRQQQIGVAFRITGRVAVRVLPEAPAGVLLVPDLPVLRIRLVATRDRCRIRGEVVRIIRRKVVVILGLAELARPKVAVAQQADQTPLLRLRGRHQDVGRRPVELTLVRLHHIPANLLAKHGRAEVVHEPGVDLAARRAVRVAAQRQEAAHSQAGAHWRAAAGQRRVCVPAAAVVPTCAREVARY